MWQLPGLSTEHAHNLFYLMASYYTNNIEHDPQWVYQIYTRMIFSCISDTPLGVMFYILHINDNSPNPLKIQQSDGEFKPLHTYVENLYVKLHEQGVGTAKVEADVIHLLRNNSFGKVVFLTLKHRRNTKCYVLL